MEEISLNGPACDLAWSTAQADRGRRIYYAYDHEKGLCWNAQVSNQRDYLTLLPLGWKKVSPI